MDKEKKPVQWRTPDGNWDVQAIRLRLVTKSRGLSGGTPPRNGENYLVRHSGMVDYVYTLPALQKLMGDAFTSLEAVR